jgi:hypothetical protein
MYCNYCKERETLNRTSNTPCADAYIKMCDYFKKRGGMINE